MSSFTKLFIQVGLGIVAFAMISSAEGPLSKIIGVAIFAGIFYYSELNPKNRKKKEKAEDDQAKVVAAGIAWAERVKSGQRMDRSEWTDASTPIANDEEILMFVPAKWMEEKVVGYEGKGSSIRMQVTKGINVGSSSGKGKAVKQWTVVSEGKLLITTQRVVFAGNLKSWSVQRNKVIAITNPVEEALMVQLNSKSYLLQVNQATVPVAQAALSVS